ncbi:FlgD immunoglobulin-like domain containing protein [Candidatus Latescibacterota bacterium]
MNRIVLFSLICVAVCLAAVAAGAEEYEHMSALISSENLGNPDHYLRTPAVWSPDGTTIAVNIVKQETSTMDILLVDVETGEYTNLTASMKFLDGEGKERMFRFRGLEYGPGGSELFCYRSWKDDDGVLSYDIIAIDPTAKTYRVVKENALWFDVSDDGKYLAYSALVYADTKEFETSLRCADLQEGIEYSYKNVDAINIMPSLTITPDNSSILVPFKDEDEDGYWFYAVPITGGEPQKLEIEEYPKKTFKYMESARYSPDGRWLAYQRRSQGGVGNIYIMDTVSGVSICLYPNATDSFIFPAWSPDSSRLSFILSKSFYTLDESATLCIYEFAPKNLKAEEWSPVFGQAIVDDKYGTEVVLADIMIPFMDHRPWGSALSPDTKWVAFVGPQLNDIYIVPSGGGVPVRLIDVSVDNINTHDPNAEFYVTNKINTNSITFTPDSQEVTFQKDIYDERRGSYDANPSPDSSAPMNLIPCIERINIYTGEHRVILEGGKYPSWSFDGRYLAYVTLDPRVYIDPLQAEHNGVPAIYDTMTGEIRYLSDENLSLDDPLYGKYHSLAFSPDGSHIVVNIIMDNIGQICKIPFEGGEPEQLTFFDQSNFPGRTWVRQRNLSYSPDGQWILFDTWFRLLVFNTETGKTFNVFSGNLFESDIRDIGDVTPFFTVSGHTKPSWSANGTEFCYNLRIKTDTPVYNYPIFISDFDPDKYTIEKTTLVEAAVPEHFLLLKNYPNPFNPATMIEFTLPEAGFANLVIYNMMGQKVRELVSYDISAGIHSVVWDGRDENGTPVSSGVFISRLKTGDSVISNRMTLVK